MTCLPVDSELYEQAAARCPGLAWTVLAAIGTVESGKGTSALPGVHSGANPAGAEGPMQFLPATFAVYDRPVRPGGPRAVYGAARDLCERGRRWQGPAGGGVRIHHDTRYMSEVLALARAYGQGTAAPGTAGGIALAWALAQAGTPNLWGGGEPGAGFDCSGLVLAAYRAAEISLPRVAQDQFDTGPHLPARAALEPGDLVFFGISSSSVTHVDIYVGVQGGQALMVDAPHSGTDVPVETFPATPGAMCGSDIYLGATRPGT